jgi:hypothetical protein
MLTVANSTIHGLSAHAPMLVAFAVTHSPRLGSKSKPSAQVTGTHVPLEHVKYLLHVCTSGTSVLSDVHGSCGAHGTGMQTRRCYLFH